MTRPWLNVMIDLETMGTKPGSAVTSVGAVAFDFTPDYVKNSEFHSRISLESCVRAGLRMDASTVKWWMTQSDAARSEVQAPDDDTSDIREVLFRLRDWVARIRGGHRLMFYGNSAAFDLGLLGTCFDVVKLDRPWKYYEEGCYRTLKNTRRDIVPEAFVGTQHNALADADHQARHCAALLRAVGAVYDQPPTQQPPQPQESP